MKKTVSQKSETCRKPLRIVTSVVSPSFPFWGNLYVVSTTFSHLETVNLTIPPRFPALETWGNLTSVLHKFPHLDTVNPIIPPRFLALEISRKPQRGFHKFPHKQTVNFRIPLRSLAWEINGYLRHCCFLSHASTIFSKRHFQSYYYF